MRAETAAALRIGETAPALAAALGDLASPEDAKHLFAFLSQALDFARPELFVRYVEWAKPTLAHRQVEPEVLSQQLRRMTEVLEGSLPSELARPAIGYVRHALDAVPGAAASIDDALGALAPAASGYLRLILDHDGPRAREFALDAMRRGMGAGELSLQVLMPAMHEVGRLWQANRLSVADEHYCAGLTQAILGEVCGTVRSVRGTRTAVVACVAGEQHSLGSRMVADFLDMTGWRALWLGASTPGADLLRMVCELDAKLLAISCTFAPHLHDVASLISALRALPECRHVKVLVGGHAFGLCDGLWRDVGADACAQDAAQAAQAAHRLVS